MQGKKILLYRPELVDADKESAVWCTQDGGGGIDKESVSKSKIFI